MILRIFIISVLVDFSMQRQIVYDSPSIGKSELENSRSKLEHFFQLSRGLLPQDFKSLKEPIDARSAYKIENSGNNSENRDTNDDTATANDSEVMDIFENTS